MRTPQQQAAYNARNRAYTYRNGSVPLDIHQQQLRAYVEWQDRVLTNYAESHGYLPKLKEVQALLGLQQTSHVSHAGKIRKRAFNLTKRVHTRRRTPYPLPPEFTS